MFRPSSPGWRWYLATLARHRWAVASAMALGITLPLANLPALWLVHHVFDTAIPQRDVQGLLLAVVAILAIRVAALLPALLFAKRVARALRGIVEELRNQAMARLHRLQWRDLDRIEAARVQSRMVTDSERVEQMTQMLFQSLLPTALPTLVIYTAVLFAISWQLALLLLVLAPLLRMVTWWSAAGLRRAVHAFQQISEGFHASTHHLIRMLRTSRTQASEDAALGEYRERTHAVAEAGAGMAAASMLNIQFNSLASGVVAVVLLALGGFAVIEGMLSVGTFAAFFFAAAQANSGLISLINGLPQLVNGHESLTRLAELQATGAAEDAGGSALPDFAQPLVFDGVAFAYDERPILTSASLSAEAGKITALAAPNGVGKTTMLSLAAGLLKADGGEVRLGAQALCDIDRHAYRSAIGMLPQEPPFLPFSVAENIRFGRPDLDEGAVRQAVLRAGLEPALAELPLGLDSPMGEAGQLLSGGARQRVALARALVHAPRLLILDEPSNHLDDAAVELLVARLFRGPERPTILMATHDPRLLAIADAVYDLAAGVATARPKLRLVKAP